MTAPGDGRILRRNLGTEASVPYQFSFSANCIRRGLLLVETMRPKSPGATINPVLLKVVAEVLRLLIGLARFTWLNKLKNSMRNSAVFDSLSGKRFVNAMSTFLCPGPRSTLRPTLPKSVPTAFAIAWPCELGIG